MKARKARKSTRAIRWLIAACSERLVYLNSRESDCHSWRSAIAREISKVCREVQKKKADLADLKRLPVANSRWQKLQRAILTGGLDVALAHWLQRAQLLKQSSADNAVEVWDILKERDEQLRKIWKLWRALENRGIVVYRDLRHTRVPPSPTPYKFEVSHPV